MSLNKYAQLLSDDRTPETFVRWGLSLLESDFREVSLLALADWARLEIASPDLFSSIMELQRPSWGHWNGLISGLSVVRRAILRSGGIEERKKVERATILNQVLALFEQKAEPALVEKLKPLSELTRTRLGKSINFSTVLTMPITLRNRLAHDVPLEVKEWQGPATALKPLIELHAALQPLAIITRGAQHPSPWFIVEEGVVWAFNGLEKDFTVRYVAPGFQTKYVQEVSRDVLLAFQRLLGKEEVRAKDFRKLLAKLAPEEVKGVTMGRYLVGRPIGTGGSATVHMGRQLSTDRKVAIKILHDDLSEEAKIRFKHEAAYLSRLNHPNIVAIIEHGEETWTAPRSFSLSDESWFQKFSGSNPIKSYISMEWLDGENLDNVFGTRASSDLSFPALVELFAQAANALATVHAAGLIHRDVKPSNLMLTRDGKVKLMDLGVARIQEAEGRSLVTSGQQAFGTPAYMSPEQIRAVDAEAEVGPATDIYSLCATFYELFTGARVFNHDTKSAESVRQSKLNGELPERPRQLNPDVPWEIETILLGGLQPEVEDRYQSMSALEQDLRRFQHNEPILYRQPSILRRAQLGYKRNRAVANLAASFLLLLTLIVGLYIKNIKAEQARTLVEKENAERSAAEARTQQQLAVASKNEADRERERTEAEKKKAEDSAIRAEQSEANAQVEKREAEKQANIARVNEAKAEIRYADSLIFQAGTLAATQRWNKAETMSDEAHSRIEEISRSPLGNNLDVDRSRFLLNLEQWDSERRSPLPLQVFPKSEQPILEVAFSPNGKLAASGSEDGNIRIVEVDTGMGRELEQFKAHDGSVVSLSFSADGHRLLSGGSDMTFKLWELGKKNPIHIFTGPPARPDRKSSQDEQDEPQKDWNVFNVALSPDGQHIISGDDDGMLTIWEVETEKPVLSVHAHTANIKTVEYSRDGNLALTSSWDSRVKVWDAKTLKLLYTFDGDGPINKAIFSADAKIVLFAGSDMILYKWDYESGAQPQPFSGHMGSINSVALSPNGTLALSGGQDNLVKLWEVKSGRELRTFHNHAGFVFDVDFSPDGKLALTGDGAGNLELWNVEQELEIRSTPKNHNISFSNVAISPDGRLLLTGDRSGVFSEYSKKPQIYAVRLWDIATGKELAAFLGHKRDVTNVAFSPDGSLALSGSADGTLKVWNVWTGQEQASFSLGNDDVVLTVAFSPDGRFALSGSAKGKLQLWDIKTRVSKSFSWHDAEINCAVFSPNGKYVLAGGRKGVLRLFDAQTGQQIRAFTDPSGKYADSGNIESIAFSKDGRRSLSGSFAPSGTGNFANAGAVLWDVEQGRPLSRLRGHDYGIGSVAFSPVYELVATGGFDGYTKLWDPNTARELGEYFDPTTRVGVMGDLIGGVRSLTFSPDGQKLVTTNMDGSLKVFDFSRPARYQDFWIKKEVDRATQALRLNPNNPEALNTLGEWYAFRGQCDKAVNLLELARRAGNDKVSALTLARCYVQMQDSQAAKREYLRVAELESQFAPYIRLCIKGIDFRQKGGAYGEVMERATRASKENPDDMQARWKRVLACLETENCKLAVEDLERLTQARPMSKKGLSILALAWLKQGNFEQAHTLLTQVLTLDPKDVDALVLRGRISIQMKKYKAAIEDCSQAVKESQENLDGHICLALSLQVNGDMDAAAKAYEQLFNLDPNNADAHYNAACLYSLRSVTRTKDNAGEKARAADVALALEHLARAIENGFQDWGLMKKDSDLDPIRNEPRFGQLVKDY